MVAPRSFGHPKGNGRKMQWLVAMPAERSEATASGRHFQLA